jgi:hypothetical protein
MTANEWNRMTPTIKLDFATLLYSLHDSNAQTRLSARNYP